VLRVLEQQHRRALAHDEACAARVEWPRRLLRRLLETRCQRARTAEPGDGERLEARLGTACKHHVGRTALDGVQRVGERVHTRGARSGRRRRRALEARADRDLPGGHVDEHLGYEVRRDAAVATRRECGGGVDDVGQAADPGADRHASALQRTPIRRLPAARAERFVCSSERKVYEG
jgi:hypothetical protein